jgi:cold shock CspA family protein
MPQGTIKKLVAEKGFGFISGDRESSSSIALR